MPSARLRMLLSTISLTKEFHSWVVIAHPEDELCVENNKRAGRCRRGEKFTRRFKNPDLVRQCFKRGNRNRILKRHTGLDAVSVLMALAVAKFDKLSEPVLISVCVALREEDYRELRASLDERLAWYADCRKEYQGESFRSSCVRPGVSG